MPEKRINFNRGFEVPTQTQPDKVLWMTENEWNMLKARIGKCGDAPGFLQPAGWFLLGISASAFFAAISLNQKTVLCGAICISGLICGVFALVCCRLIDGEKVKMRGIVLEDIEAIERRCKS